MAPIRKGLAVLTLACYPLLLNGNPAFEEACRDVRKKITAEQNNFGEIQSKVSTERLALRQKMSELQATNRELTKKKSILESESEKISISINGLSQTLSDNKTKANRLRDSLHFNFSKFYPLYGQVFADRKILSDQIDKLEFQDAGVNLNDALTVGLDTYLRYFDEASTIRLTESEIYDETGKLIKGRLFQAGLTGGAFWGRDRTGVVYMRPSSGHLSLIEQPLSPTQRRILTAGADKKSGLVSMHLDISNGMALNQLRSKKNWRNFFETGGFVMYPLALIGVAAFLMIIERIFLFLRFSISLDSMRKKILRSLETEDYSDAAEIASQHRGPTRRFWQHAVELGKTRTGKSDESFQHLIISELPVLERFLSSLAIFAAICPLLGLLGTVSGMIKTFEIITLYGTGNSALLSQGISEALVTTQVGLVLAIPILLAHSALSRKAKTILGNMDEITGLITRS